jgi:hypothetical protein
MRTSARSLESPETGLTEGSLSYDGDLYSVAAGDGYVLPHALLLRTLS